MLRSTPARFACFRIAHVHSRSLVLGSLSGRLHSWPQSPTPSSIRVLRRELHSDFPSSTQRQCPACSAPLPTPLPICPKCKHIEPISPDMGYHEMFGFNYEPNPFDIDTVTLRHRFRKAITVAHPDRWAGRDEVCINYQVRTTHVVFCLLSRVKNNLFKHSQHP